MKTCILLTVDTEPSVAGAFMQPEKHTPLFDEPVWGVVDGESQALGFILRTLGRYGRKATFFIETVSTTYFGEFPMRRVADSLTAAGQDVQLHLHPCWHSFRGGWPAALQITDQCADLDETLLADLIVQGCDKVERWTGRRPIAMRTGNFSTARTVYRAIARAGLKFASNICIGVARPRETELALPDGIHLFEGVYELPVTCFRDLGPVGRGRWRPLQVTACSFSETRALLEQAHAYQQAQVVIVTHPFEFIKAADMRYSGLRRNRLIQRRLEKLCAFVAANDDRFEMITFADIVEDRRVGGVPHLTGDPWRSLVRAVQNTVNDRIGLL